MAAKLLDNYKQRISSLELIPSGGGCFEFKIDDDLVYSKLATGRFPNDDDLLAAVGKRIKQTASTN